MTTKTMKSIKPLPFRLLVGCLLLLAAVPAAYAGTLVNDSSSLTVADSTQQGRLSRSGIPATWAGNKTFPGTINAGTAYAYRTYTVTSATLGTNRYVQIQFDESASKLFAAAYTSSFDPASQSTNYVGDTGASGNPVGGNPAWCQVFVPAGQDLVVVVSDAAGAGGGLGSPYTLRVESFLDTTYTDLAYTPTLTAATTNEDTQTSSGLVITANTADSGGTTNYQITSITGGTLYKSDGTTAIASDDFITKAEGAAGLKFSPTANAYSPGTTFGFSVQASVTADASGLKDSTVAASITVSPVADTPSVTSAITIMNIQTASGLVITRNAADGAEVTYFKISNIQNGTLYQNDGTTAISAGDFITVAQGGAGLKFTPTTGYTGSASFDVQGSLDNAGAGLSSATTANIVVATVNPTPVQAVPTDPVTGNPLPLGSPYPTIRQTGLIEVRVNVTNTTAAPINGFQLSVNYSAYLAAQPTLRLYNASTGPAVVPALVNYPYPVAVGATVTLKLEFYTSTRQLPNPFDPALTVTTLQASQVSSNDGSGVQPRIVVRADGTVLLEWDSTPGLWYRVKYSADATTWNDSPVPIQAAANRTQWVDDGAPFTNVSPATVPQRFYRVNEIPAP